MTTQALRMAELLSLPPKQRRQVHCVNDLESNIANGIPAAALRKVREALGVSIAVFSQVIGISPRTFIAVQNKSKKLDPLVSDRLARVVKIVARAEDVFGSPEKAQRWLHKPVHALGGSRPFDKLATDPGTSQVEDVLVAIEHGVYV